MSVWIDAVAVVLAQGTSSPSDGPDTYGDFLVASATSLPVLFIPVLFVLLGGYPRTEREPVRHARALCWYAVLFANAEMAALLGVAGHKSSSLSNLDHLGEFTVGLVVSAALAGLGLAIAPLLEEAFPASERYAVVGPSAGIAGGLALPLIVLGYYARFGIGLTALVAGLPTMTAMTLIWWDVRRRRRLTKVLPVQGAGEKARAK